jgi:medium-chain acyl-[acyl-carrier-protein] hydrolase
MFKDWVRRALPPKPARLLFCFPYAGGDTWIYRSLEGDISEVATVCPVSLPGRGPRFGEPAYTAMEPLVRDLACAMQSLPCPFALMGHSLGALVAFEVALQLRELTALEPLQLIVCGHVAPHRKATPSRRVSGLSDSALRDVVLRGRPDLAGALSDASFCELYLPVLRADYCISDDYCYRPRRPLGCPITVIGGVDDDIRLQDLEAWKVHTTAETVVHLLPGGHFFIEQQQAVVAALLRVELSRLPQAVEYAFPERGTP